MLVIWKKILLITIVGLKLDKLSDLTRRVFWKLSVLKTFDQFTDLLRRQCRKFRNARRCVVSIVFFEFRFSEVCLFCTVWVF